MLEGDGLKLAATSRDGLGSEHTRVTLLQLVEATCACKQGLTESPTRTLETRAPQVRGEIVSPLLLKCLRNGQNALAGVAALHFASDATPSLPSTIGAVTADLLINAGDVQPRPIADVTPLTGWLNKQLPG